MANTKKNAAQMLIRVARETPRGYHVGQVTLRPKIIDRLTISSTGTDLAVRDAANFDAIPAIRRPLLKACVQSIAEPLRRIGIFVLTS